MQCSFLLHFTLALCRIHENLASFNLFDKDWSAEDELLLLQGIDMYGMGNWRCVPKQSAPQILRR